jgi:two-component system, NtrC family, sensor histidine kinase HydH
MLAYAPPDPADTFYPLIMAADLHQSRVKSATGYGLFFALLVFAALAWFIPGDYILAHNILHHLNFLPLMMAGMLFGLRGAAAAAIIATLVNAPGIAGHWSEWPMDAQDQIVELTIFSTAGLFAGYLSDRERSHRQRLHQTQLQLEQIYRELHANVAKMKQAERLSAAGRLAASLAHEIRNPLASISGAAGILSRGAAPPEYVHDSLDIIQKESQRLNKLLTSFLNFANPRSPRLQRTDPAALLHSVALLAAHVAEERRVTLVQEPRDLSSDIECDPEQLKQVLLNLVLNAIEASPADSAVNLSIHSEGDRLLIEVADQGAGIAGEMADRIFDPFFTTKTTGTGLGLAISSMIVSHHGGALSFRNNADRGATFRVELPVRQEGVNAQ